MLPPARREVFHPYSDRTEAGLWANSYAYEEAFGEKLRALAERTRPRDLYDVVNLYRHSDSRPTASVLRNVLEQKCAYKAIPMPTVASLAPNRGDLEAMWANMLGHQLPVLPPVADFWDALPEIFAWINSQAEAPQRVPIEPGANGFALRARVLPMGIPVRSRSTLEIIRFAAANHLCVDLTYDRSVRRIEPYSLRQTADGNFVLHAVRKDSGEHRSYRVDRMQGASVTAQAFAPRYLVELTPRGAVPVAPPVSRASTVQDRGFGLRKPGRTRRVGIFSSGGPVYLFRCPHCRKTFERKSMDASLNAHKNPRGYPCTGRLGTFVRTKY